MSLARLLDIVFNKQKSIPFLNIHYVLLENKIF